MVRNVKVGIASLTLFHFIFIVFCILCVIPIIAILSISLSDKIDIVNFGYRLIPRRFSTEAYIYIFRYPKEVIASYGVSVLITALGGIIGLFLTALYAYPLSRPDFKYRNIFAFYIFFTMIFNGGLVPTYIVVARMLHLSDTIWALIMPYVANAFFVIVMRTYFQTIPISLVESAKIDGSSEFRTFFTIILPLSKPALATIGLFIVLNYWNDWYLALLYVSPSAKNLVPLQYMLYKIMANIQYLTQQMQNAFVNVDMTKLPSESARMAMCIVAAGPMLFIFPFFQKYFVKGLTVGAIKG